ncbi:hypothetical protein ED733_002231 [Metarhizium rileyi]|uniref:Protein-arginine deiminase C-terminal domain-containing protein n=1 Tax=Metarhizium rileyi (strain RCEF 4871) TaxID=1649241 RepID=A0A5C6G1Z7_METRR|nr:hypothetical protein ED733_002231 [Metarhizium rileyi]
MYYSLGKTAVLALVAAATTHAFKGIILADTNRDGRVDVTGNTDFEGKANWTEKRGALFLPNIVDTGRRCSSQITDDTTESGLAVCNDASDNILRQPQYLAPLRTLPIPNLNSSVTGTITLSNQCARDKVRVFRKDGGKWIYVGRTHVFNASALRPGLELGIDGRDVRRPNEWDGRVTVTFQLTENRQTISSDAVTLRVAPILTHHHLQAAKRVFTVAGTKALGIFEPAQQQFADFIGNYTVKAGAVQYFTCNTPNRLTTDSTGNLEAIPPYSYKGKDYPAGRAVMGRHDNVSPTIMAFLKAQEAQYPIDELDHDWLLVGHTDEYMQFLPANNPRGWVMTLADPERGMSLLKNAQANGHGKQRAMSRTPKSYDPKGSCLPTIDIDGVLGLPDFEAINKHCADRIKYNMDIIKRETGLTESEIVRVPSLFYHPNQGLSCNSARASRHRAGRSVESEEPMEYEEAAGGSDEPSRFEAPKSRFLALFPETVNGVVYPRGQYMAPNPWGPIIGGKDIIADAVSKAYATVGFNATFMDDWFDHHVQHGETHCGSNTARDASQKWW